MPDLLSNAAHVPDDGVRRWRELRVSLTFLIQKATVNAVSMRGHKINSGAALLDVGQKLRHPCGPGGSRASDSQSRIDGLDGFRGQIIEPK